MTQEIEIEQKTDEPTMGGVLADQSDVLLDTGDGERFRESHDEQWQERESRNALKHVAGLGEKQDVTEVEYRKVTTRARGARRRMVFSRETTAGRGRGIACESSPHSPRPRAPWCATGLLQHRIKPDAATYVGSGKARELARHRGAGARLTPSSSTTICRQANVEPSKTPPR